MTAIHGARLSETGPIKETQAIGRRPVQGGTTAAYPNTPDERAAAALTCADRATGPADLGELLAMLGLDR